MKHGTNISFWKFLEKLKRIDIPRIQRDYVQGVKDGTGLGIKGQRLVDAVLEAAEHEKEPAKRKSELVLDFIYGVINNGVFFPLDGQQRLTLLWLLHWYLAFRSGKLKEEKVKEELKKFTYSTRSSSKQFMSLLLDPKFDFHKGDIDEQIEARSWFYTGWHNDPTIASMLVVLRRIDKKFHEKSDADIENIWDRLTGDNSNLLFHYLDLEEYAKPDDLFIKMNARGKLLEPLDNFKSDLINHLKKHSKYDDEKQEWVRNFNGKWIEVFWGLCDIKKYCTGTDEKSIPPSADTLFYRFICRIFIDRVILILNSESPDGKISVAKIANSDLWKNLYNAENRGKYSTLDPFIGGEVESSDNDKQIEELLDKEKLLESSMDDIGAIMENLIYGVNIISKINEWASPYWTKEHKVVEYIPSVQGEAGALSNDNRPIFHAVVSFIRFVPIKDEKDWESMFKAWMRFVWNIHENSGSHAFSLTRSIEKYANELLTKLESTNQFYERLAGINIESIEKNAETQLEWQVQEEIEKAEFRKGHKNNKDVIDKLESLEKDFEGQIYYFYKNNRKLVFPISCVEMENRYNNWEKFKNKELIDKTKELLKCYNEPRELNEPNEPQFVFPKGWQKNFFDGKNIKKEVSSKARLRLLTGARASSRPELFNILQDETILDFTQTNTKSNIRVLLNGIGCFLYRPYKNGYYVALDEENIKLWKKLNELKLNKISYSDDDNRGKEKGDLLQKGYVSYDLSYRVSLGDNIYFCLSSKTFTHAAVKENDPDVKTLEWNIKDSSESLDKLLDVVSKDKKIRIKIVSDD